MGCGFTVVCGECGFRHDYPAGGEGKAEILAGLHQAFTFHEGVEVVRTERLDQ